MPRLTTIEHPIAGFHGETATLGATVLAFNVPPGAREVMPNGAGAWRGQLGPKLVKCLVTGDSGVTFTDYTSEAIDKSASTDVNLSSLKTAANGGYWYIASRERFAGIRVDVDDSHPNGTESTLTGFYWNGGSWITASITDGTKSGSTTLAADGNITWTMPNNWAPMTLDGEPQLYVMRFQVSVALDSDTLIDQLFLLPDSTANPYGYFATTTDYVFGIDPEQTGALCANIDTGTPALNVTWIKYYV